MQMCPCCSADNRDSSRFCSKCGSTLRKLLGRSVVMQGRYRLLKVIGSGGMGAVYLAQDDRLGNARVAMKENLDPSAEAQDQFINESKILAHLSHPNLPRVRDFFVERSGRQYMVMDYIEGEDLQDLVERQGPLPHYRALAWMNEIFDAVEYLHGQKQPIIHRDIKPGNIKITPFGKPVLVDFGIAKLFQVGAKTQAGARAVSPGFSPIEQYGQGTTTMQSDVYALGAMLYFMLTGSVPPEAIDRVATGTDHLIPPRSMNLEIPPVIERAIWHALRLQQNDRYPSVRELRLALSKQTETPVPASPPASVLSPERPNDLRPMPEVKETDTHSQDHLFTLVPRQGMRLVSFSIDALSLPLIYFVVKFVLWPCYEWLYLIFTERWLFVSRSDWQQVLLCALAFFLYRVIAHANGGQTVGKRVCRVRVVSSGGGCPSFGCALARESVLAISVAAFGLGLVWMLFDPRKQGWHDIVAGTSVVRGC